MRSSHALARRDGAGRDPAPRAARSVFSVLAAILLTTCGKSEERKAADLDSCTAQLAAAGVRFEPWAAPSSRSCTVVGPIVVQSTRMLLDKPLTTSCAMALAWTRFEPELQAIARAELGGEPRQLLHFGSYACRAMTGNAGRMSEHASGRALDVAGFAMADGRRVLVERDWNDRGPAGRFLRAVAAAACRRFSLVLTPDSDRDHRDHLHLDIGPWRRCG